jgi:hypothetical protein
MMKTPKVRGTDCRKQKRYVNGLFKKLKVGGYYTNCNYHPVRLTEKVWEWRFGAEISGIDLITNGPTSCSMVHCGPTPISEKYANELVETWKEGGDKALAIKVGGWTPEAYDEFEKTWRTPVEEGRF